MKKHKTILLYIAKFLGAFCLLFYGTEAVIGLSAPGAHYSPFVARYLDFISPFRAMLLWAAGSLLSLFNYQTVAIDEYTLSFPGGKGIRMVYSCLGYGVISFWIAFVFANKGSWKKKAGWMLAGAGALCAINIIRIGLLLVAINKGWPIPLGWDHHTWFNIVAYALIFGMIWAYDRGNRPEGRRINRGEEKERKNRIPEVVEEKR